MTSIGRRLSDSQPRSLLVATFVFEGSEEGGGDDTSCRNIPENGCSPIPSENHVLPKIGGRRPCGTPSRTFFMEF